MKIRDRFSMNSKPARLALLAMLIVAFALVLYAPGTVQAAPPAQDEPPDRVPMENDDCLACHKTPDMYRELPSGEQLYLTVDPVVFKASIHGRQGYSCTQCHTDISGYPHPELTVQNAREWTVQVMQACMQCHTQPAEEYASGHHADAYLMGNTKSATCIDCHSSHQTKELSRSPRFVIAQTCATCHAEVYEVYKNSVHGEALLEEGNWEVPTCVDCHNDHANAGPSDPGYLLFSPQICAKCHADEKMMNRYGINTDVFETYVADFHGTTVTLFEQVAPDQETNKPVCVDCHGVHDIQKPDQAYSSFFKDNIDATCRRCHPGAMPEFGDAWLSHYPPDLEHNAIVYLVNMFYSLIIPGTVGGMLVFISAQVFRRWRNNQSGTVHHAEGEDK